MKVFHRMLAPILAALAFLAPTLSHAISGTTALSLDFPNIVILYYPSTLNLTFTAPTGAGIDQIDVGAASGSANLGASAVFDAGVSATGGSLPTTTMTVTVQNAWAVRGISSSGNFTVSATLDSATNTTPDPTTSGSQVTLSNLLVGYAGTYASSLTVSGAGFGTPTLGDIQFTADLSNLILSGTYSGYQYTITATAP